MSHLSFLPIFNCIHLDSELYHFRFSRMSLVECILHKDTTLGNYDTYKIAISFIVSSNHPKEYPRTDLASPQSWASIVEGVRTHGVLLSGSLWLLDAWSEFVSHAIAARELVQHRRLWQ